VDAIEFYQKTIEEICKQVCFTEWSSHLDHVILPRNVFPLVHSYLPHNIHNSLMLQEDEERQKVITDPNAIMPAAFVSFKTRWGAAVCAQTQQTSNPTVWLTEWAPEPRDVYWANLAIPFVELSIRRLLMAVLLFFLTFFFMVPIAIVQSLANLDDIERLLPFLKPIIER
jgi:hypothetical protein